MKCVAYPNANIQCLRNPIAGNASGEATGQAVDVSGSGATVVVNIASQPSLVVGIADKENALDSIECSTSQARQGIHSSCGTLGVTLQNETLVGVAGKLGVDTVDDLI
jgi:hypothetical protein